MINKALRYEITQAIPELAEEIYPTNAPVGRKKPYLVYYKYSTGRLKTLDGYVNGKSDSYIFSVMAGRYEHMTSFAKKIENLLISMPKTHIGENGDIYVQDITLNATEEVYEEHLKLERGIIDFTIHY